MALTFYYAPMSTATLTQLVLAELGVPHEAKRLDTKKGETKSPEFLAINPNGLVPTIVHDGVAIWESSAITMYLGELFGVEKGLYPAPGPRRGEAMKWIAWTNVTLGEAMYRRGRAGEWVPPEQRNQAAHDEATKDILALMAILDAALTGKQFLLGDQFTLADTHVCSIVDWMRMSKIDLSGFPALTAWSARCSARPAYKQVMSATAS